MVISTTMGVGLQRCFHTQGFCSIFLFNETVISRVMSTKLQHHYAINFGCAHQGTIHCDNGTTFLTAVAHFQETLPERKITDMGTFHGTRIVLLFAACLTSTAVAAGCSTVTQFIQCKDLICNETSQECVPCTTDEQCYHTAFGCFAGKCQMKPLKELFQWTMLFAPLVGFLVCGIAVLAGVGGGAILVPVYALIIGTPMEYGVALSQATICGQSLLNVFLQLRRYHPNHAPPFPTRPNINYEYSTLLLPLALTGTSVGSVASKVSPDWLRVVLLLVLFSYVLVRLIRRVLAQRARDKETKLVERQVEGSEDDNEETSPGAKSSKSQQENVKFGYVSIQESERSTRHHEEKPQYPALWICLTLFIFAIFSFLSYAKSHMVTCGGTEYYFVIVSCVVSGVLLTLAIRGYLCKLHSGVLCGEREPSVVPFNWGFKTTILFPFICIVAGFAASMLGIGGGLVCVSLLLEAGLQPEHASATGGLMTLLIAVQSAADYDLANELRWDFGLMMFAAGLLSAAFGQFVLMRQIKKHGWTFLIVAALASIMGGSMLAVTAYGVYTTIKIESNHGSLGFAELC
jgi:uncharacterized membrane protein YfcA